MPIAIDPSSRIPVVLESDEGKENPPTFYVRPLTMRETRNADTLDQRMREANAGDGDPYAVLVAGVRVALVGWANINGLDGKPITFDLEKIEDVLTIEECFELMRKIVRAGSLSKEDKKKSESQPLSAADNSANTVPAESVSMPPAP